MQLRGPRLRAFLEQSVEQGVTDDAQHGRLLRGELARLAISLPVLRAALQLRQATTRHKGSTDTCAQQKPSAYHGVECYITGRLDLEPAA